MLLDRKRFERLPECLALTLAVSLPWSTSATGILAVLWLLAGIPTIDLQSLRRIVSNPAGGFPLLLVALGALGMLWAGVPWTERFASVTSFLKLLFIPLLMHQFSRTGGGRQVLIGFLVSYGLLLALSWLMIAWPGIPWHSRANIAGIPVKDYISQSTLFTICIFVIGQFAYDMWHDGRRRLALALIALALIMLANVFYVATARTALVVIPVLTLVFGYKLSAWKGAIGLIVACFVLAAAAWPSSTYLRTRIVTFSSMNSMRIGPAAQLPRRANVCCFGRNRWNLYGRRLCSVTARTRYTNSSSAPPLGRLAWRHTGRPIRTTRPSPSGSNSAWSASRCYTPCGSRIWRCFELAPSRPGWGLLSSSRILSVRCLTRICSTLPMAGFTWWASGSRAGSC